jgi:hypothetical protein
MPGAKAGGLPCASASDDKLQARLTIPPAVRILAIFGKAEWVSEMRCRFFNGLLL